MATPKHTGGIDLEGAAELWQTPNVPNGGRVNPAEMSDTGIMPDGTKRQVGLEDQVRRLTKNQFPTPAARDYRSESGGGSNDEPLQPSCGSDAPSYDRTLFPPGPADREQWAAILRDRPDLAPAVEYEIRDVAARVAAGMDFTRADQLRGLGNMVVPQQGALALLLLLERREP